MAMDRLSFRVHAQLVADDNWPPVRVAISPQHGLPPVAKARSLYGNAGEGATELVDHQGGQGFAIHILGDDQKFPALLCDLLQNGKNVLASMLIFFSVMRIRGLSRTASILSVSVTM